MAINKNIQNEDLIKMFIEKAIFLKNYESTQSLIDNNIHSYNTAKSVASEIKKILKQLISSEEGVDLFVKLLGDKNIAVAASAAEFLYPMYPQKCIKILKRYSKSLNNKLDRYKVDCKIEGLEHQNEIFLKTYKKLYGCDDLDSLNQEKGTNKE